MQVGSAGICPNCQYTKALAYQELIRELFKLQQSTCNAGGFGSGVSEKLARALPPCEHKPTDGHACHCLHSAQASGSERA